MIVDADRACSSETNGGAGVHDQQIASRREEVMRVGRGLKRDGAQPKSKSVCVTMAHGSGRVCGA